MSRWVRGHIPDWARIPALAAICDGPKHFEELNLNLGDRRLRFALKPARELIGAPRRLLQHPSGFIPTHGRLAELVPIEPAAMRDR